jgi:hypothetical protein
LDAAIALPPIPIQRPTRAGVVVESTVAVPKEEVVAGSQQELVPGGQQVIGSPRTAAAGGDAGKVPVERTDAELIDAFEALLNKLF